MHFFYAIMTIASLGNVIARPNCTLEFHASKRPPTRKRRVSAPIGMKSTQSQSPAREIGLQEESAR